MLDLSPWEKRPAGKRRKAAFVYFVEAPISDLIKIGVAVDMAKRLVALQCGSPEKLNVVAFMPDDNAEALESRLHDTFSRERRHGEWFEASERLESFIVRNALSPAEYEEYAREKLIQGWVDSGVVSPRLPEKPVEGYDYSGLSPALARYKAARGIPPNG